MPPSTVVKTAEAPFRSTKFWLVCAPGAPAWRFGNSVARRLNE